MIQITDKQQCSGCYGCYHICPAHAISMPTDHEGFWYPEVDHERCLHCGRCKAVCPCLHHKKSAKEPQAYACYNRNETIRLQSSSGGIFTLLAEAVLDEGGVVFGAVFDEEWVVVHDFTQTKAEMERFRGSKYVQSKIGDTYQQVKRFLAEGIPVLFSGTPCQIGGLKAFLGKEEAGLLCLDLICHGVPSPKLFAKYVRWREKCAGGSVRNIIFRQKVKGWKHYRVSFEFENALQYAETGERDPYMRAFLKDICLRPSCYACNFKTLHRQSDITLADFWGVGNIAPEMDDDQGTSLVMIHSAHGSRMFEKIKPQLAVEEVEPGRAISYNPSAIKSVAPNPKRVAFLAQVDQLPFDSLVRRYCAERFEVRLKQLIISGIYVAVKEMGILPVLKKVMRRG